MVRWDCRAARLDAILPGGEGTRAMGLRDLFRRKPTTVAGWCDRGMELVQERGDYRGALACFAAAVELDGASIRALTGRGNCRQALGLHADALSDALRLIELDPGNPAHHNNAANALNALERFEEAAAQCDLALELAPFHAGAWTNLGASHERRGETERALDCYGRALQCDPYLFEAWHNKASLEHELGRHMRARDSALACVNCSPPMDPIRSGELSRWFAELAELAARDAEAQMGPDGAARWYEEGLEHAREDRLEEALSCFDRALERDPWGTNVWNNRGNTLRRAGDLDGALEALGRALILDPHNAGAWFNRALVEDAREMPREALFSFHHFLGLAPPEEHRAARHLAIRRVRELEAVVKDEA